MLIWLQDRTLRLPLGSATSYKIHWIPHVLSGQFGVLWIKPMRISNVAKYLANTERYTFGKLCLTLLYPRWPFPLWTPHNEETTLIRWQLNPESAQNGSSRYGCHMFSANIKVTRKSNCAEQKCTSSLLIMTWGGNYCMIGIVVARAEMWWHINMMYISIRNYKSKVIHLCLIYALEMLPWEIGVKSLFLGIKSPWEPSSGGKWEL